MAEGSAPVYHDPDNALAALEEAASARFEQWKFTPMELDDPSSQFVYGFTNRAVVVAPALGRGNTGVLLAEGESAARTGGALQGPYIHGINKGGLSSIVAERKMLASDASGIAGGQAGVRAYTHSLDKLAPKPSTDFVEFFTQQRPTSTNPGQSSVLWQTEAGQKLDVIVTRIAHPDGTVTIFPQTWW